MSEFSRLRCITCNGPNIVRVDGARWRRTCFDCWRKGKLSQATEENMVCTICYDWCNDHSEGSGEYWLALGEWEGRSPEIARLQPQKGETTSGVPICDDCGTAYLFDGGGTQKSVIIMGCKFNVSNTLREGV